MSLKKRYRVINQVEAEVPRDQTHGGPPTEFKTFPSGSEVELTDDQAAFLIERGAIEPTPIPTAIKAPAPAAKG